MTKGTNIVVGMAAGNTYFPDEQKLLSPEHASLSTINSDNIFSKSFTNSKIDNLENNSSEASIGSSSIDILVCTPGRLVGHIQLTKGFTLRHLRFLVLDEADRLLGRATDHWIRTLIKSIGHHRNLEEGITTSVMTYTEPSGVQLLLFSATLTDNPQKLAMLGVHAPLVIRTGAECSQASNLLNDDKNNDIMALKVQSSDTSKTEKMTSPVLKIYNLPLKLEEMVCIGHARDKPIQLASILYDRYVKHEWKSVQMTLVFSSSLYHEIPDSNANLDSY